MLIFPTLYKKDARGKTRVWLVTSFGDTYTVSQGTIDGKKTVYKGSPCLAKNIGKANATTPEQQAEKEAKALWDKKLGLDYFESVDDIDKMEYVKPMLAEKWKEQKHKLAFAGEPYYLQPKLDGMRCIARKGELRTRRGKIINSCPHIIEALKPYFEKNPNMVLDGELYNHQYREKFNDLMSILRKESPSEEELKLSAEIVQYHMYDSFNPEDVGADFLVRLKPLLVFYDYPDCLQVNPTSTCTAEWQINAFHEEDCYDFEGSIIRTSGPYAHKRSKTLMKRTEFISDEFEVREILEGKNTWAGMAKKVKVSKNGVPFGEAGIKGNRAAMKKLLKGPKPDWATIEYRELTGPSKSRGDGEGVLRFGVMVDWGWGKRED